MILGLILGTFFFICAAILMFISDSDTLTKVYSLAIMLFAILIVGVDAYDAGKKDGIEIGAYNQLYGKYRITHEIDADSCVIDTIIHFD